MVGLLFKGYCIYFLSVSIVLAIVLLVYSLRQRKLSGKAEKLELAKLKLTCSAITIISVIALATIWRWWL